MVRCARCGSELDQVFLCLKCFKAFCKKESDPSCELCGGDIAKGFIIKETWGRSGHIEWLQLGDHKVGLVDFEHIPKMAGYIFKVLQSNSLKPSYKILLFPSKKSSFSFMRLFFSKETELEEEKLKKPSEKSRYSIIVHQKTSKEVLLLNEEWSKKPA